MQSRSLILSVLLPLCALAQDGPDASLVGYWNADGNTSRDLSNHGNHGTFLADANARGSGIDLTALTFDGTGDCVDIGTTAIDLVGLQPFTISAWVYRTDATAGEVASKYQSNTLGTSSYIAGVLTTGAPRIYLVRTSYTTARIHKISTTLLATGQWYHVAFTYGGGTTSASLKIYVNGVETAYGASDDSGTFSPGMVSNTQRLLLGARTSDGTTIESDLNGMMDEMLFVTREMSAAEIQQLFQARPQP